MPSRRAVLLGGVAVAGAGLVGAGVGIQQGVLPGRPLVQAHLGLNGEPGRIPKVKPGRVEQDSFVSAARGGVETGWSLILPPGPDAAFPVVVALHWLGADHTTLTGPRLGLDRYLAAHVEAGGTPFAIVAADGGRSYWHPRPDGEDASAMIVSELLPRVQRRGLDTTTVGLLGWSMGGYGALRLAGLLGPRTVRAVAVASPAIWSDADEASTAGFEDADEYEQASVVGRQRDLEGIAVRVDCGTGDPFYRDVQDYVEGFRDGADLISTFDAGGHDPGYWRRMLPAQLDFLGGRNAGVGSHSA